LAKRCLSLLLGGLLSMALLGPAAAQQGPQINLVRDAEVENIIRAYAAPVFRAGGFDPKQIKIFLVNDRSLNAFVAGGLNIFMNTGLLMRADDPNQVIGVLAHELGHIVGGHLARMDERMREARKQSLVTMVLGALAGAAVGRGDAAMAVITGSNQAILASFLKYSQTQESSADAAGVKFMDQAGISSRGLADFMRVLANQELLAVGRQDPYMRTHPVTQTRVEFIEAHNAKSPYKNTKLPPEFYEMHHRMKAKLAGFIEPINTALQKYPESDTSIDGRYARAIAYYRKPDLPRALQLIDGLLAERPNDPYFNELKGQMLFENGHAAAAVEPYQRAVSIVPESGLLRTGLAQVQIESQDPAFVKSAIANLEESWRLDDENLLTLKLLATAYGRDGQHGMASLQLAELAFAQGRNGDVKIYAERAINGLKAGSPAWQRAHDVKQAAERKREED
jgi:predicted Zn-dependent protease